MLPLFNTSNVNMNTFSNTLILFHFFPKTFIKSSISSSKYFFEQMLNSPDRNSLYNSHSNTREYIGIKLYVNISYH